MLKKTYKIIDSFSRADSLLFIISVVGFILTMYTTSLSFRYEFFGHETKAKVISYKEDRNNESGTLMYSPILLITELNSSNNRKALRMSRNTKPYKIGELLDVKYLKPDSTYVVLNSFFGIWAMSLFSSILFIVPFGVIIGKRKFYKNGRE